MKKVIFWDVDTQNDFMDENGALYVPGSENIKPNLRELTRYALEKKVQILGSVDTHFWKEVLNEDGSRDYAKERALNREQNPQYQTEVNEFASEDESGLRLPLHCRKGTWGHQKIEETLTEGIYIQSDKVPGIDSVVDEMCPQYLEKHSFTPTQNKNWDSYMYAHQVDVAVVYGVVSGICIKAAVEELTKNDIDVYIVEDAIMDFGEEDKALAYKTFEECNAKLIKTEEVLNGLFNEHLDFWEDEE